MRSELRDLLRQAGLPGDWLWDRIAVVDNSGPIRPSRVMRGDFAWNRGFNLILFEQTGKPTYFCKCRPAHNEHFLREMELTQLLSANPDLRGAVPATRTARSENFLLQVSDFLPGPLLSERLPRMSLAAWELAMVQGLELSRRVAAAGVVFGPELRKPIALAEVTEPAIRYLEDVAGLGNLGSLRRIAVQAGEVPSRPQHGDLWPGNLLSSGGIWHLLDLEHLGEVRAPFYDVFHLVRTSWDLRRPTTAAAQGQPWLRRLACEPNQAEMTRSLLRAQLRAEGLHRESIGGLLAYYLLDIAYRSRRRGIYYSRLLTEVVTFARLLEDGADILTLLFGKAAD